MAGGRSASSAHTASRRLLLKVEFTDSIQVVLRLLCNYRVLITVLKEVGAT